MDEIIGFAAIGIFHDGVYKAADDGHLAYDEVTANFGEINSNIDKIVDGTILSYYGENVQVITSYAFYNCQNLSTASFPKCSIINTEAFYNCASLTSLYLLGSSVCRLSGTNIFGMTPNSLAIYVPESLYGAYKTNSTWSSYSDHIQSAVV